MGTGSRAGRRVATAAAPVGGCRRSRVADPWQTPGMDPAPAALPTGYTARPIVLPDDAAALHALDDARADASADPYRSSAEGIAADLAYPAIDLARGSLLVHAPDGSPAGWATIVPILGRAEAKVFLHGAVHPAHMGRGIGRALVAWSIARGEDAVAAAGSPPVPYDAFLHTSANPAAQAPERLLAHFGFRPVRWFASLRRDFAEAPPDPVAHPLPEGIVRAAIPVADPRVHAAHLAAFADHWGSAPQTAEEWVHNAEDPALRPAWCAVAMDTATGAVAGYLTAAEHPEDRATTGPVGWIWLLGTVPGYRGRGIATALLEGAAADFAAAGLAGAMLGVDTASQTGADRLYAQRGFRPFSRSVRLRREPGASA